MNLKQLQSLCAIEDEGFNISRASTRLRVSQPGISKQLRLLERELGVDILVRRTNRVLGLSEPGKAVASIARRMLREVDDLGRVREAFSTSGCSRLVVVTTHIHARYVLLDVVERFARRFPQVRLVLRQGAPSEIAQLVMRGDADLGISGEPPEEFPDLAMLPCYELPKSIIVKARHPLLRAKRLTLHEIARYPLLTFDASLSGGVAVQRAFQAAGLSPHFVLTATDSDVVKAYVARGLGVGIVPSVAAKPPLDHGLRALDGDKLFERTVTRVMLRRRAFLSDPLYAFIAMIQSRWDRQAIDGIIQGA